jgi:hypothetical protein
MLSLTEGYLSPCLPPLSALSLSHLAIKNLLARSLLSVWSLWGLHLLHLFWFSLPFWAACLINGYLCISWMRPKVQSKFTVMICLFKIPILFSCSYPRAFSTFRMKLFFTCRQTHLQISLFVFQKSHCYSLLRDVPQELHFSFEETEVWKKTKEIFNSADGKD